MPIVTIARQLGSHGNEISRALAARLNYRYLDTRHLPDYVREFGDVEPTAPEMSETQPTFWERLNEERQRHAIIVRCGVYNFAKDDDAVIVGLGANFLLKDVSHTLRCMTIAPLETRVRRVADRSDGAIDRAAASDAIRRSDRERNGYIRYMHNADWTSVRGYDLILNTQVLTPEQGLNTILYALERADVHPTATSMQQIDDLALGSRVEAVLISNAGIWVHGLRATADRGVVTVAGEVITDEDREYAEDVARGVSGVRGIVNELRIQPPPLTGM